MPHWNIEGVNSFKGVSLIHQTTYEQKYLRAAIRLIVPRLVGGPVAAAEFGAGYGRLTTVLEDFFSHTVGFERESNLISAAHQVPSRSKLLHIERLDAIPVGSGELSFSFVCTVLQHMVDEHVHTVLAEMRRVTTEGRFILLIESSLKGWMHGDYGTDNSFTKGRGIDEYQEMMNPWLLDFVRPRHMGDTNGQIWGHFMMFRGPHQAPSASVLRNAGWSTEELRWS